MEQKRITLKGIWNIILYLGAEFTKAYAVAYGSEIRPAHYAVTTKEIEVETGNASVMTRMTAMV